MIDDNAWRPAESVVRRDLEHHEQVMLFKWAEIARNSRPELWLLFAVPNFARVNVRYGARMKREGKKAGVPDVWLPIPRGDYHGLVGEMKIKPNTPTEDQRAWLAGLRDWGWCTHVWWSWEEAKTAIERYLDLPFVEPINPRAAPRTRA